METNPQLPTNCRNEQGYVLVVFMLFAALLLVGLSAIIPKAAFEGRRDKEEELIFRGLQYQHAIQLFVRKMGRYPTSVEQLQKTNGFRFLRKTYADPMTKDGKWRLIHIGANGAFIDAQTSLLPAPNASGLGSSSIQTTPGSATAPGTNTSGFGANGGNTNQPGTAGGLGSQPTTGSSFGGGLSGGNTPQSGGVFGGAGTPPDATSPSANPGQNPQQPRNTAQNPSGDPGSGAGGSQSNSGSVPSAGGPSSSTSTLQTTGSTVFGGGAIAGVASLSKDDSIKVWNTYKEYDKWEFIYDLRRDPIASRQLAGAGTTPQPGSVPVGGNTGGPSQTIPPGQGFQLPALPGTLPTSPQR